MLAIFTSILQKISYARICLLIGAFLSLAQFDSFQFHHSYHKLPNMCVELEENHQQLKDEMKDVKGQLSTLQEQVQMLLNNIQNSDHSARQSLYTDNVGSNGSDANPSNDFEE